MSIDFILTQLGRMIVYHLHPVFLPEMVNKAPSYRGRTPKLVLNVQKCQFVSCKGVGTPGLSILRIRYQATKLHDETENKVRRHSLRNVGSMH